MLLSSLGLGGLGAIGGIINSFGASGRLNALKAMDPQYKANPIAAQRMGLAQTLLQARMPGATAMERNIYGNQANQMGNVNRNVTDSSQALAMGSAAQGQTNQAFQGLATQEQGDYYNRLQNLGGAQQGMIQEGDKVYQDQVRRYQDQASILGAQMQNTQTGWNSLANLGFGGAGIAAQFGGGGQGGGRNVNPSAARNSYMNMGTQGMGGGMNPGGMPGGGMMNPYQNSGMMNSAYPGMPQ
jgi:hypothetical protein